MPLWQQILGCAIGGASVVGKLGAFGPGTGLPGQGGWGTGVVNGIGQEIGAAAQGIGRGLGSLAALLGIYDRPVKDAGPAPRRPDSPRLSMRSATSATPACRPA